MVPEEGHEYAGRFGKFRRIFACLVALRVRPQRGRIQEVQSDPTEVQGIDKNGSFLH